MGRDSSGVVERNQMGILMMSCPESKGLPMNGSRLAVIRPSRSEASDGPVFLNQTRDAAEVTGVSRDEGTTMLQHDCRNSQVHPADIQP